MKLRRVKTWLVVLNLVSQNLIDCIATVGIIQARSQEHVLNCLQKLHSEEEEHSGGQFRVVRSN